MGLRSIYAAVQGSSSSSANASAPPSYDNSNPNTRDPQYSAQTYNNSNAREPQYTPATAQEMGYTYRNDNDNSSVYSRDEKYESESTPQYPQDTRQQPQPREFQPLNQAQFQAQYAPQYASSQGAQYQPAQQQNQPQYQAAQPQYQASPAPQAQGYIPGQSRNMQYPPQQAPLQDYNNGRRNGRILGGRRARRNGDGGERQGILGGPRLLGGRRRGEGGPITQLIKSVRS